MLFVSGGFPGAYLGSTFTHLVSDRVLLLCFGALMLATGLRMLSGEGSIRPAKQCRPWASLIAGFAVGILTGFLGVGGGIIILPALILFAGLETKTAIGTSLAVIAANCLAGLIGQFSRVSLDIPFTFAFLAAAASGMFGGLALVNRVSSPSLRRIIAWLILAMGFFLLLNQAFAPQTLQ